MSQMDSWDVDATFGCRIWNGSLSSTSGRPIVWRGRTPTNAYVVAYEQANGKVPDDLVVDHLCRRVLCVFAGHLEAVTKAENERRKSMRYRMKRTTCPKGHRLDEATRMLTPEMGILCRNCLRSAR